MSQAEISVIIVNYGTADLAVNAVQSVLDHEHGGRSVDVHLVDNASPGDEAAILSETHASRNWGDRVSLYLEAENHGFGRGNNLVLRALASRPQPPKFSFLLNPDAYVRNEALDILAQFLENHPNVGAVGARIEKPSGEAVTAAFQFPGVISEFSDALAFGPVDRLLSRWRVPLSPELPRQQVDWVSGAAFMVRTDMLKEIGFFDSGYFLYYEEVDLMKQAANNGWEVWYVPEAEVVHSEGAATGIKSNQAVRRRRPAYWYDSWRHYFQKNHGRAGAIAAGIAWVAGASMNNVLAFFLHRPPAAPLVFFQDFWATAGRPLLGLKARNRD